MKIASKFTYLLFAAAAVLLVHLLLEFSPLRLAENVHEDLLLVQMDKSSEPSDEIIVLEIGESTLSKLPYRSPVDRGFLASVLNKLIEADVKAVGVDIFFDQPTETVKDNELSNIFAEADGQIFVAYADAEGNLTGPQADFQEKFLENASKVSVVLLKDNQDGIVRYSPASEAQEKASRPHLTRAMAGLALREDDAVQRIRYQAQPDGAPHVFTTYPAEAALALPGEWFSGKYVLIGTNIAGVDQFRTPFASTINAETGTLPGVVVHAHILNQILAGREALETSWWMKLLAMFVGAILGIWLTMVNAPVWGKFLAILGINIFVLAGPLMFADNSSYILPSVAFVIASLLTAILNSALMWQSDRAQKLFVRNAWSQYVSPGVVENLIENPEKLQLGGERVDASYIFTDIAGFTSLAETISPEKLASTLNQYLDMVSNEFIAAGATLDKIVGDAVIGFFGAPLEDPSHPDKAVALALRLNEKCQVFQKHMIDQGLKFGTTRIGVHSGPAMVGNLGGTAFFDYTALGDSVNTAARLEAANKSIGSSICVSGDTAKRAIRHSFRPVGKLYLAGKRKTVETFEPISGTEKELADFEDYLNAYSKLEESAEDMLQCFEKLGAKYPKDHLVEFHLQRLRSGQTGMVIEVSK